MKRTLTASDCNKRFGKNAYEIKKVEEGVYEVATPEATYRKVQYKADDFEVAGNSVTMSISSEHPVMVYGEAEIISHDAEDISFARLMNVGAILRNHDPDQIVGKPTSAWLDEAQRKGRVTMEFGSTELALRTKQEVMVDKTLRGVSIGFRVGRWIWLENSDTKYKNFSGPAWVGVDTEVLEASFTPIPADATVGVNRAVSAREEERARSTATKQENENMKTPEEIAAEESAKRAEQEKQQREAVEAAQKQERARTAEIYRVCAKHEVDQKHADEWVESGETIEHVRSKVLDIVAMRHKEVSGVTVTKDGRDSFREAAVDGMRMRSGARIDKPADGARELAGKSLLELCKESLQRAGIAVPNDVRAVCEAALRGPRLNSDILMRAASSNNEPITEGVSDFPLILANLANKELLSGYESQIITYDRWCRIGSLNDFKQAGRLRLSEAGDLELIPENEKYPDGKFSERREPIALSTYGKRFGVSRQVIINDDVSAFTAVPRAFGRAAARKPNELAAKILLSNPTLSDSESLFSVAHQNLVTIQVASLTGLTHAEAKKAVSQAVTALFKQKQFKHADEAGVSTTHGWQPEVLVTPATPWDVFRTVLGSTASVDDNKNSGVINAIRGIADHVIEPTLEDSTLAGNSANNVYLFANPNDAPVVEVAFLQGNRLPYMEEIDQTDSDGRIWKVRLDVAAAVIDWPGAVKVVFTDSDS